MSGAKTSEATRQFWNTWPCDGQSNYKLRAKLRYTKEPFILHNLKQLTSRHSKIVEIGCGQGTDAITACQYLKSGSAYFGIDNSNKSITSARKAAEDIASKLHVYPNFEEGDALALPFENNSIECIYSMGVFHHIDDTQAALNEVHRVLKPGGICYIFLYRLASPKILIAYVLRGIQKVCDSILRQEKVLLKVFENHSFEHISGTMFVEAFGVPVMHSYTNKGIQRLFSRFEKFTMTPCGFNWPFDADYKRSNLTGHNLIGNFFFVTAAK